MLRTVSSEMTEDPPENLLKIESQKWVFMQHPKNLTISVQHTTVPLSMPPDARNYSRNLSSLQSELNMSFRNSIKCKDYSLSFHMICEQMILTENCILKLEKTVEARKRNKAGWYSDRMRRTESEQQELIRWYKKHFKCLKTTMQQLRSSVHAEQQDVTCE